MISRISWSQLIAVAFVLSLAIAERSPAQPPIKKEDLRYDGQPFAHWQTCWKTELKVERRLDAMRAMAGFGTKGYAEEAAAVILEIVQEYDSYSDQQEIAKVIEEAQRSLVQIGPKASLALATRLNSRTVSIVVDRMVYHDQYSILPAAVPLLAQQLNKDEWSRSTALFLLCKCGFKGKENVAAIDALLDRKEDGKALIGAIVKGIKDRNAWDCGNGHNPDAWAFLAELGSRASLAVPALAADLMSLQKTVKKEIEQNGITNNTGDYAPPPRGAETPPKPPEWCIGRANDESARYIKSLGELGPVAKDAIPVLEIFAKDSTPHLTDLALKAIQKIRSK